VVLFNLAHSLASASFIPWDWEVDNNQSLTSETIINEMPAEWRSRCTQ